MDKKQIENAANAYTQEIIDSNTFDVNFEEDNYDAGSLHATSEVAPTAFKDGAEWRINSVWHDASEEANAHRLLFIESVQKCFFLEMNCRPWEEMRKRFVIKRWAYAIDLLPTKKNDAE